MLVEPRCPFMCPWCGGKYDPATVADGYTSVPRHDHEGIVCQGSDQAPRNAVTDRRPLWSQSGSTGTRRR